MPRGASADTGVMSYQLVIFDFDGTLADSFPFFISVFNEVAAKHGFKPIAPHEIEGLRRGSTAEILKHLGLPKWKVPFVSRDFMHLMRERSATIAMFDGVEEALAHLRQKGVLLAVVSSNAADNVRRIMGPRVAGMMSHVDCGVSMFGKASRIKRAVRRLLPQGGSAIYVGDQLADMEAAGAAGVACAAVPWGYAAIDALRRAQPQVELANVAAIKTLAGPLPLPAGKQFAC